MPRSIKVTEDPSQIIAYAALVKSRRDALQEICARLFADTSSFVWEVGSGHGHFLTAYAAAHAGELCIGVDLVPERVARANRKKDRARLGHLHFLRAEARDFLAALPEKPRFSAIYILFPDPWPKRRHHKHRLMQVSFLTDIASRAGEGARLYFRTDYKPYFDEVRSTLQDHSQWLLVGEPWPFEEPTVFQQRAQSLHSLVAARKPPPP
jgi:tRNA (guanine-N7-)-methyltransferase